MGKGNEGPHKTHSEKLFQKNVNQKFIQCTALSSGLSVSKNTVYEYFSYLEDIGFVIPVQKFGFSEKEKMKSIAKLYLIDTGFASVYGVEDKGLRMENLVATELLRRKYCIILSRMLLA